MAFRCKNNCPSPITIEEQAVIRESMGLAVIVPDSPFRLVKRPYLLAAYADAPVQVLTSAVSKEKSTTIVRQSAIREFMGLAVVVPDNREVSDDEDQGSDT